MGMVVQHNMNALNAYNRLNANVAGLRKASEKLASGYRINRAGDDAAGLAISEKMRSQIKGLNQAVRNSQDGINMIQTYEGAAQETHSILQRMKELAVESANGTYDNATDRAAIQLEFDQLNDELNQIADTDFNGTVVLNGGVMADGTVAKGGEFRYAEGYTETVIANTKGHDLSGAQAHTMADQSFYTKEIADAVYSAVKVDVAADSANSKIGVTFMYDGERWVADTVTNSKGEIIDGARAAGLEARPVEKDGATGNGGFEVIAGKNPYTGKDIVATNVIFDEMTPVTKGDTVTVYFDNSAQKTYAPKNAGLDECYDGTNKAFKLDDAATIAAADLTGKISFALDKTVNDNAMNADLEEALTALDNAEFTVTYANGKATITAAAKKAANADDDALKNAAWAADADPTKIKVDATTGIVTYEPTGRDKVTLGKLDVKNIMAQQQAADPVVVLKSAKDAAGTTDVTAWSLDDPDKFASFLATKGIVVDATGKKGVADGAAVDIELTATSPVAFKVVANNGDNAADVTISQTDMTDNGWSYDNTKALIDAGGKITIGYTPAKTEKETEKTGANGTVTFSVNVDAFNFADMADLSVHTDATPKVATMAAQVATPGVSVSNSFKNSTGVLTYTDNLTLQTGARTKDSVNFSFSYNTDGTADMGNLVANLDLSSRSTGLNTANLSLANQDDANYAIDQIDKAINKTSMVRATFGSIQNRLEHKITNLTTTAENLTEAESSIRDTDMASEMMNYTKFNILQQAAQSMLAQANQQPQSILQLLG